MTLKRLIDSEAAGAIRRLAGASPRTSDTSEADDERYALTRGVFNRDGLAIVERDNARASCRECGGAIDIGVLAVVFDFDPFYADTGGQAWGSLSRAYIHAAPCKEGDA